MAEKRFEGLFIVAAGVAAAFLVVIETGYRVTRTPGSPIGDVAYLASIGVLIVSIVATIRIIRPASSRHGRAARAATGRERDELAADRRRSEAQRRERLESLADDPRTEKYVIRIMKGEAWSDDQIDYDLNIDRVATCSHLAPIEREMRASGIEVRLQSGAKVDAACRIDADALRARFDLPPCVSYAEPAPRARAFDDPLPALITCAEHSSAIGVVHPLDASANTPVFPAGAPKAHTDVDVDVRNASSTDAFMRLRNRLMPLARLIDVPAALIPTRTSTQTGLPHIEIEGDTYHYVHEDRGVEHARLTTTSLDELLYHVFRDITWSMSSNLARPHHKPGDDYRREMFREQLMLLEQLNPEWASRCATEHAVVLRSHPFVDERAGAPR